MVTVAFTTQLARLTVRNGAQEMFEYISVQERRVLRCERELVFCRMSKKHPLNMPSFSDSFISQDDFAEKQNI